MNILLTGASSFTGYWFARALSEAGHHVTAPLRRAAYTDGLRAERVRRLAGHATILPAAPFGSDAFLAVAARGFDVLCHHAAEVGDYRSPDFDVPAAVAANLHRLHDVLATSAVRACIVTGSVFEPEEGAGEVPRRAFSPYAVSKSITARLAQDACAAAGIRFSKFTIANPFGPFEEPRFCDYLVRTWRAGGTPDIRTPRYVRDNIHVAPLARAYALFVTASQGAAYAPSGYVETQGAFAHRFAAEIGPRLNLPAPLRLADQRVYEEPRIRANTDPILDLVPDAEDSIHWDRLADYYRNMPSK